MKNKPRHWRFIKKKKIVLTLAIMIIVSICMPLVAQAYITSGTLDATRQWAGGPHLKYTYINGANVSLYWITNGAVTNLAYPIGTPNHPGAGDSPVGQPATLSDWSAAAIGTYPATCYPKIGGNYTNFGTQYTATNITNEKAKVAIAYVLISGYPLNGAYTSYGLTTTQAQYATNVQLQNISALLRNGTEGSSYSPTAGNEQTAAYCYAIGQTGRVYLMNSTAKPLTVAPASQTASTASGFFTSTVTFTLPAVTAGATRSSFYTNNYTINTSAFPTGTIFQGYTGVLDVNGQQTVTIKIPVSAATGGKTYTSTATGTYINRTANVNIYNANENQKYVTADEIVKVNTSNVATPAVSFSVTTTSKPDLYVESVLTNKEPGKTFEAGDTVIITAKITNGGTAATGKNSIVRLSQVAPDSLQPVGFDQGTAPVNNPTYDTTIPSLAAGASTTCTWTFVTPIRVEARTVNATVTADATNVIDEFDETNNSNTIYLTLNPGKPDFTTEIYNMENNTVLVAGYDAVVSAWIGNIGKISSPSVDVSMTVNGQTYTENICVPTATRNYPTGDHPLGGNLVSFRFRVPDTPGTYQIVIKADPDNKIAEENENNNSDSVTVTVQAETVTPMVDAGDSSLKSNYNGSTAKPSYTSTNSLSWNEVRQTGTKTYETVSYTAALATDFTLRPGAYVAYPEPLRADVIESGFGLEADATVSLMSDCNDPDKLVGPQYLYVYYPDTNYGNSTVPGFEFYHESMERISGNEYNGVWAFQENPFSSLAFPRVHYTPLWYPDGQYTAVCMALSSWTPAGKLTCGAEGSVTIAGDMYDRVSVVAR